MSGVLLSLANPPPDLGPLAFVALIPLLSAIGRSRPRRGALAGFVFGLVYYGILLYWLLPFGVIAWLPLVLAQSCYVALFGASLPWLWRPERPIRTALAAGALWTILDWVRAVWPLGGFTWGALGNTQHANGFLLPLASVTGVWGVTFVVLVANCVMLFGLRRVLDRRPAAWRRVGAMAAVALALVFVPAAIPIPAANGPRLRVAVVQGNVPIALASDRLLQSEAVGENHIWLNRTLASDPPDLAVWPENALDRDPTTDPQLGAEVAGSVRTVGTPTLIGAITDAPRDRYYNQVLLYSADGQVVGRYTKQHLVPFGEYVPWRWLFSWTDRFRPTPRDLAPGHRIVLFPVHGLSVAAPICFENVFPDLFRRFVASGANVVVLTTNDSSFLRSPASREHVIMSQLRAVETARWIVQGAISGESAVVDPHGRVVRHTGLFVPAILRADVPGSSARTIYTRLGDWFPWTCGLVVLALLAARLVRRRGSGAGRSARAPAEGGSPPAGEEQVGAGRGLREAPLPISGGGASRTLVILPTFNERQTIGAVLEGVVAAGPGIDALVIDDGSPDGTGDVVADMAARDPRIRLIDRQMKQGLASAYLLGFAKALEDGYDVVVEMDADLSHRPEDLPRVVEGTTRFDLSIGSRYVPGGAVTNWGRTRLALSRAGNAYTRTALGLPVADATSGFRAYRRRLLQALVADGVTSEGYAFQIELAYRAWKEGFSVGEVPITFREREHGQSKLSRRIVAEALLKVGRWGLRDRFRRNRGPSSEPPGRHPG